MENIKIINRRLTPKEIKQVDSGFDTLYKEEHIEVEHTEQISFIALKGENLIGCVSGLAYKNGQEYSGWFYLSDLFVEKAYRNKSIGSKLLIELERKLELMKIKNIWLWTSGPLTLKFYDKHGYSKFVEMKNWYSDGSSRIGLRKIDNN